MIPPFRLLIAIFALIHYARTVVAATFPASDACEGGISVSSSGAFVDACGRQRNFRGINNVIKGFPFAPEASFVPGGGSLSPTDAAMFLSLGFNSVRLGVMWQGAVPLMRGGVNVTYLDRLANLTAALFSSGIYSLLDAHQDGMGPAFCDDGAPVWWTTEFSRGVPGFPMPLEPAYPIDNRTGTPNTTYCGEVPSWFEYYFTDAVGACFNALYTSKGRAQTDFTDFWSAVVTAYHANRANASAGVLGYELLNEPWAGDVTNDIGLMVPGVADALMLQPFYANVSRAIRATEAKIGASPRVIFMEPVTWDNFVPAGFTPSPGGALPWSGGPTALSYHYYPLPDVIGPTWEVELRADDARRLGAGGVLTEFDVGLVSPVNAPYSNLDLRATLDACERTGNGWMGWAYASLFQGDNSGMSLYVPAIRELARSAALALAGSNATSLFTVTNGTGVDVPSYRLTYLHAAAVPGPTLVYVSTGLWFNASTLRVNVSSVPPGAVSWSLESHAGTVLLPSDGALRAAITAPFAYAHVVIVSAPGAPPVSSVTVTVD